MKITTYLKIGEGNPQGYLRDHPSVHLRHHHGGKGIEFPMGEGGNVAMFVMHGWLTGCSLEQAQKKLGGNLVFAVSANHKHQCDILVLPNGAPVYRKSRERVAFEGGEYGNIHP